MAFESPTCVSGCVSGEEQRVVLAHREFAPCGTYAQYLCQVTIVPDDLEEAFVCQACFVLICHLRRRQNAEARRARRKHRRENRVEVIGRVCFLWAGYCIRVTVGSQRVLNDDEMADSDSTMNDGDPLSVKHVWISEHKLNVGFIIFTRFFSSQNCRFGKCAFIGNASSNWRVRARIQTRSVTV